MINRNDDLEVRMLKLYELILPPEKFTPEIVKYIKEAASFRKQLTAETPRGSALYAGSYLENLLENLLRNKLIGSNKHLNELLSFNGAIGSFSSKINISYSIGLINQDCMSDLHIIRKIRNEFGHSPKIIDFQDRKISDLCSNLKLIARDNVNTPRQKFNTCIHYIIGQIEVETVKTEMFVEKSNTNSLEETKDLVNKFLELHNLSVNNS